MRLALLTCAALLVAPAAARAADPPSFQVGSPPAICSSSFYTDQVLTNAPDEVTAGFAATRLWGLDGDDLLTGSPTRATCVLGGRGDDRLSLGTGGGIVFGESGDDVLVGSALGDRLRGGQGIDAFASGAGDDDVDSRDGVGEVLDCGAGDDLVRGDRADVLIGCETARLAGAAAQRVRVTPSRVGYRGVPRLRMRLPQGGGPGSYRVLLVTGKPENATPGCTGGPVELTRFPAPGDRVRAGQRVKVGVRPPQGGFCRGTQKAVVLRATSANGPGEAIARLSFRVTG